MVDLENDVELSGSCRGWKKIKMRLAKIARCDLKEHGALDEFSKLQEEQFWVRRLRRLNEHNDELLARRMLEKRSNLSRMLQKRAETQMRPSVMHSMLFKCTSLRGRLSLHRASILTRMRRAENSRAGSMSLKRSRPTMMLHLKK